MDLGGEFWEVSEEFFGSGMESDEEEKNLVFLAEKGEWNRFSPAGDRTRKKVGV